MKRYLLFMAIASLFVACTKPEPDGPVIDEDDIPANKEIVYRTYNNSKEEPYNKSAFGANILSNTYSKTEKRGVIKFDNKVTKIGDSAFSNCSVLSEITIPNSVTYIGAAAFDACSSLVKITLGDKIASIGAGAFALAFSYNNEGIVIPNSVTSIGESAFETSSIKSVVLSENITKIEKNTFNKCYYLQAAILPEKVTLIDDGAFTNCWAVNEITIPDNVAKIGNEAFYKCKKLSKVIIGTSVASIGNNVFDSCGNLTELYCKATVPPTLGNDKSLGDSTNANLTIYVPTNSVEAYKSAKYWNAFGDRIVGYDFK